MNENNNKTIRLSVGSGFWALLQIAFIVLKLCGVISWAWGLVLLPLWIYLGIVVISIIITIVLIVIMHKRW